MHLYRARAVWVYECVIKGLKISKFSKSKSKPKYYKCFGWIFSMDQEYPNKRKTKVYTYIFCSKFYSETPCKEYISVFINKISY